MKEASQILNGKHYLTINTKNGIMDREELKEKKREILLAKLDYILDDILPHKQDYPNGDTNTAIVEIKADFAVLKKEEYEMLINQLDYNE